MKFMDLETPALLIDREILRKNLNWMQDYADRNGVALRPHAKTHKMPKVAQLQMQIGANGIAVAKVGEAEVMAAHGIGDIFIANQIAGTQKLQRILKLMDQAKISFGVDSPEHIAECSRIFAGSGHRARILIEIEVGENRSGIIHETDFSRLLEAIKATPEVEFLGIFSHDGNSYEAPDLAACHAIARTAQERTLRFSRLAAQQGMPCRVVSYGSTPTLMNAVALLDGITEIRPGTYALMDASQANAIGTLEHCAATVLATVISRPTPERVILDVGAKGLTMQSRTRGICATPGLGTLLDYPGVYVDEVFDEHAIIYSQVFRDAIRIGDKVRILPVHICPVCNLYDTAWLVGNGEVIEPLDVAARGKLL